MTIQDIKKDNLLSTMDTIKKLAHRENDVIIKKTLEDCADSIKGTYRYIYELEIDKATSEREYDELLTIHSDLCIEFKEYRKVRTDQFVKGELELKKIIATLEPYAEDPEYVEKLINTVTYFSRSYPDIFRVGDEL